jgi:hypothetical protein
VLQRSEAKAVGKEARSWRQKLEVLGSTDSVSVSEESGCGVLLLPAECVIYSAAALRVIGLKLFTPADNQTGRQTGHHSHTDTHARTPHFPPFF